MRVYPFHKGTYYYMLNNEPYKSSHFEDLAEYLQKIKTKNDALLHMKNNNEYVRYHCKRLLKMRS